MSSRSESGTRGSTLRMVETEYHAGGGLAILWSAGGEASSSKNTRGLDLQTGHWDTISDSLANFASSYIVLF
jgi:hypothetical protein